MLLGGFKTLLKEMEEDNVKPDIKTFTQLLNIMPSTTDSEEVSFFVIYSGRVSSMKYMNEAELESYFFSI